MQKTPELKYTGDGALKKLIHKYEQRGGYVWLNMFEHILELEATYPVAIAEFALKSNLMNTWKWQKSLLV